MGEEEELKDVMRTDVEAGIPQTLPMSTSSSSCDSSTTLTSQRRRRRLARRITSMPLVTRAIRLFRFILGPSTRLADSELPQPQPSFSLGLVLPTKSWHLPVDERLRSLSLRFHLSCFIWPFLALWAMGFVLLIRQQYYVASPPIITCDSALWGTWPPDTCGINGTACMDSLYEGTYRCMGGCRDVPLGNPRWIGGEVVNGEPLVIGGDDSIYRADSWICPSAIHAGLISPTLGGCVTVQPLPFIYGHSNFTSSKSHSIQSVGFEPNFPGAYQLESVGESGCLDLHPIISFYNAICLFITALFLQPSPGLLFSILVVLGWFQITLVSDTANIVPNWEWVFGGVPAVLFASYWAWRVAFKRTLKAFTDLPLDVGIWQGTGFWIGMESSIIFSKIPIQRLGYGQLSADGIISLVVIVIAIFIVVLIQAWQMRKYGMLQYYLFRYLPLAPILIILSIIPGYTLRIHHYLYTLAAIPVLSLPNRISLFGQAFVFGLFLDGVGRWGWASILQQTTSLIGDAISGTYVPYPLANSTASLLEWAAMPMELASIGFTGVSVIVDDILRGVSNGTTYPIGELNLTSGIDHFVRLAYVANGTSLDFIDPIQLSPNGTWSTL